MPSVFIRFVSYAGRMEFVVHTAVLTRMAMDFVKSISIRWKGFGL